ncbi:hypothetical protein CR513_51543, partial [Mucuna pruriens]
MCWSGYGINKFSCYTKLQDNKSIVQNNVVMVMAELMHFSTLKDKNHVMVTTNELGFTFINLNKVGYKEKSFIMEYYPKQKVDSCSSRKKNMHKSDENQDTSLDLTNTPYFSSHMPTFNEENKVNDVHVTHHDHIEGLLENILQQTQHPPRENQGRKAEDKI